MKSILEARGDRNYMFTSEIDLTFTSIQKEFQQSMQLKKPKLRIQSVAKDI